jgi:type II pantothenate kinase
MSITQYPELVRVMGQVSDLDDCTQQAIESCKLIMLPSGSDSPCIDFSRVEEALAKEAENADLIVIVGMGRCVELG